MVRLKKPLQKWRLPEFDELFKEAVSCLGAEELPLQQGLTAGSYALDDPLDILILSKSERADAIEVKIRIFYKSLTPGCACPGDPTVENEQTEQCTVLATIDKRSAETRFTLQDT